MSKTTNKILKDLSKILEKKNLKLTDNVSDLKQFDSIIILQIINLCSMSYQKKLMACNYLKVKKFWTLLI